jgi:hypothetical protein
VVDADMADVAVHELLAAATVFDDLMPVPDLAELRDGGGAVPAVGP